MLERFKVPEKDRVYVPQERMRAVTEAIFRHNGVSAEFAEVSTDRNPVHLDDAYAQDTIFEGRIAHGMLTAGLISAVIGEQLPGHGTIYMGQNLKFLAPVRPGDTVRAEVEVVDIEYAKRRVKLDCRCLVDGKKVLVGEAMVLAPSAKFD